jgi:predicted ATPase
VFWFDQFRNLASPPSESEEGNGGRVAFDVGVSRLRQYLNRWQLNRMYKGVGRRDYLQELEDNYKKIFPGRFFAMPEPMFRGGVPSPEDFYFIINDANRTYDIEEMSAGEQAVFPILYEFIRLRIRNAVVLIDEVDLNLHPPLAQALLAALPTMGPNCQFLLTTHAEAISTVVSPEQIHRLPGGRLCL